MIMRDKGNFYKADAPLADKIENELDVLIKKINQSTNSRNEEIKKLASQISKLTKSSEVSGAALTSMVTYNEQIIYGGQSYNIIKDITLNPLIAGVILTDATDLFSKSGHGLVNNDIVVVSSIITTTGLSTTIAYYVINVSGDDFQVSLTPGGAAVVLSGGNGSCSIRKAKVIALTRIQPDDIIELLTVITKTADEGILNFYINDGTNDLFTLGDLDASITSAQTPVKGMWIEYSANKDLILTLVGGSTFVGKVIAKILRKPQVNQGFAL